MTTKKTIRKFDKPTCRIVAEAMEKALKSVADEYGLAITVQGGKYDGMSYTAKVVCATLDDSGDAQGPEVAAFKQSARYYGLAEDDLGREFTTFRGDTYTICGLAPKSRKYPILGRRSDGKVFKFTPDTVTTALKKAS